MGHDPATGGDDEIDGAETKIGRGRLPRRLGRGEHRHDRARFVGEHGVKAFPRRGDRAVVAFGEFVANAVDMHVIRARQAPDFLPGDIGPSEQRVTRQVAPAISMSVDRQLAEARKLDHADEADRIDAGHQARGAVFDERIMPVPHLVEVARQIKGEHHFLAAAQRVVVDHPHDGFDALVERARRTVRLQFVVLDEIDAGAAEVIDKSRRLGGTQADARLDDGPDQRSSLNPCKAARPRDAKPRPRVGLGKFRRQADIQKTQSCNRL